jgi:hypothetical protein
LTDDSNRGPAFAHPTEEAFARILDYYGVDWAYEPRTFPLAWDHDGNVTEAFSPDFYLPKQDLYVELTTLRPKFLSAKHRKMRKLQELYPDVNIKLFRRREIRDLMIKYGLVDEAKQILGRSAQDEQAA